MEKALTLTDKLNQAETYCVDQTSFQTKTYAPERKQKQNSFKAWVLVLVIGH